MIRADGWQAYCIWEHSAIIRDLYARRCREEAEEMTCSAQAAELLAPYVSAGDTLLDVGCGSGYCYHSLRSRGLPVEYYGIDAAPSLIAMGREYLPRFGLPAERLQVLRIEDLNGQADHVLCMNVLSNLANYHHYLERLLHCAKKTLVLRESLSDQPSYRYVKDKYLDPGFELSVYVNTYRTEEVMEFVRSHGFTVRCVTDRRAQDRAEMVIDYPHWWKFLVALKGAR